MPLKSYTAAELLVSKRFRFERPLLLMIWIGVALFSLAEGNAVSGAFYVLAGSLAVGVNLLAVLRRKEIYLRRLAVNVAVIVATVALGIELTRGDQAMLVSVGHYLILIQLCKLFERKSNRDYIQMLVLSMLLALASLMLCFELWFVALLGGYFALSAYTVMVFNIKRGLDAAAQARLSTESAPLEAQKVAWNVSRAWPGYELRNQLFWIMLTALLAGIAMFLVAPRDRAPADPLLAGGVGDLSSSGFSTDVKLGDAKQVYLSDKVLMQVQVTPPADAPSLPADVQYLRGVSLDRYEGSRWSQARLGGREMIGGGLVSGLNDAFRAECVQYSVSMVPSLLPSLFGGYPVVDALAELGLEVVGQDLDRSLRATRPERQHARYRAWTLPQPLSQAHRAYVAELRERQGVRIPQPGELVQVSERVAALARSWTQDLLEQRQAQPLRRDELDLKIAQRLAGRLMSEYAYTLDLRDASPSRDGVEDFLFHMKKGHCEYFASALAVMCHACGVRARLTAGFCMSEYDSATHIYTVRGRDAHAWTEVYTPSTDWVVLDATPASRNAAMSLGLGDDLRRFWERLKFLWYEHVIGFDEDKRREFWSLVGGGLARLGAWARLWAQRLYDGLIHTLVHGSMVDTVMLVAAVILAAAGLVVEAILIRGWIRRLRHGRAVLAQRLGVDVVRLKFLANLFKLLRSSGLELRPGQTLREYAQLAAERLELPCGQVGELIELYYGLRWGRTPVTEARLRGAEALVEHLQRIPRCAPHS